MYGKFFAAAVAAFLIASPLVVAQAQTDKKTTTAQPAKKLTPQQQKMKDCSVKWNDEKKAKKVSGKAAHNKFMSECLKAKS